jgi:hypothetical protein
MPIMDLHEVMNSLQHASDLDLLRLRTAIDHLLQQPARILAVRQRLHVGQEVDFWNRREDRMRHARIVQFKPDQLLVQTDDPAQLWWVSYAALQLDQSQAPASRPAMTLQRSDFSAGDAVSFTGRDLIEHVGTIVRVNQKTATVSCDSYEWRVPFTLLRRVVDI